MISIPCIAVKRLDVVAANCGNIPRMMVVQRALALYDFLTAQALVGSTVHLKLPNNKLVEVALEPSAKADTVWDGGDEKE